MNRISITYLTGVILCIGLLSTAANASPPVTHTGNCEVNDNGKLNGYCFTICPPYHTCCSGLSSECPTGRRAKIINYVPCDLISQKIDPKKVCHF